MRFFSFLSVSTETLEHLLDEGQTASTEGLCFLKMKLVLALLLLTLGSGSCAASREVAVPAKYDVETQAQLSFKSKMEKKHEVGRAVGSETTRQMS